MPWSSVDSSALDAALGSLACGGLAAGRFRMLSRLSAGEPARSPRDSAGGSPRGPARGSAWRGPLSDASSCAAAAGEPTAGCAAPAGGLVAAAGAGAGLGPLWPRSVESSACCCPGAGGERGDAVCGEDSGAGGAAACAGVAAPLGGWVAAGALWGAEGAGAGRAAGDGPAGSGAEGAPERGRGPLLSVDRSERRASSSCGRAGTAARGRACPATGRGGAPLAPVHAQQRSAPPLGRALGAAACGAVTGSPARARALGAPQCASGDPAAERRRHASAGGGAACAAVLPADGVAALAAGPGAAAGAALDAPWPQRAEPRAGARCSDKPAGRGGAAGRRLAGCSGTAARIAQWAAPGRAARWTPR